MFLILCFATLMSSFGIFGTFMCIFSNTICLFCAFFLYQPMSYNLYYHLILYRFRQFLKTLGSFTRYIISLALLVNFSSFRFAFPFAFRNQESQWQPLRVAWAFWLLLLLASVFYCWKVGRRSTASNLPPQTGS